MRPLPSAAINGVEANRFPHVVSVYLPEVEASALVRRAAGSVAVSMGLACSTNDIEPSHVLVAMGLEDRAHSTVRISFGRNTTHDDVRAGMAQLSMARRLSDTPTSTATWTRVGHSYPPTAGPDRTTPDTQHGR